LNQFHGIAVEGETVGRLLTGYANLEVVIRSPSQSASRKLTFDCHKKVGRDDLRRDPIEVRKATLPPYGGSNPSRVAPVVRRLASGADQRWQWKKHRCSSSY
jgi:hypothetical protein